MKLSIVMPAYNEAATIGDAIERVLTAEYPCQIELVIVDDGSTDATGKIIDAVDDPRVRRRHHTVNRGKGAAVRTGADVATGDYLIIFDADLEYHADDIPRLLVPILDREAEVVYGARTFGSSTAHSFWFVMGNKVTTFAANAIFNAWIHDLHTCLKVLPLQLFRDLSTRQSRFGMDTELTALILAHGIRPYEVAASYKARSHAEGKKITWKDGVAALGILVRVRWRTRRGRHLAAHSPSR